MKKVAVSRTGPGENGSRKTPGRRRQLTPVTIVATMVVAGLIGMVCGLAFAALRGPQVTVSASISVRDDADALLRPQASTSQSIPDPGFIPGEIAVMSTESFQQRVADQAGVPQPNLTYAQQGTSQVLTISSTQRNAANARKVVEMAIAEYTSERTQRSTTLIDSALDEITARLSQLGQSDTTVPERARLLEYQSNLLSMKANMGMLVPVLSPPTEEKPPGISPNLLIPMFGFILGAAAAAAVLAIVRHRDGEKTLLQVLASHGYNVLVPALDVTSPTKWARFLPVIRSQMKTSEGPVCLIDATANNSAAAVAAIITLETPSWEVRVMSLSDLEAQSGRVGSVAVVAESDADPRKVAVMIDRIRAMGIGEVATLLVTKAS